MSENNNDIAEAILKIPEKFAQIWEDIKKILFGTGEAISEGIKGIIDWIVSAITGFINWVINVVNTYIVQPVISFLTSLFPWIWERIHRTLIIVFTVPPTVRAIKKAIRKPGEWTFIKIALTPVMGYFGGEIAWHLLNAFLGLKPGQVPQLTIPGIMPTRPGVTTTYPGKLSIIDTLEMKDALSFQTIKGLLQELSDQLNITDELTLETISYVAKLTDEVKPADYLTVRAVEPTSIVPTDILPVFDEFNIYTYYKEYKLSLSEQLRITDVPSFSSGNIPYIDTLNIYDRVVLHHGIPPGSYILTITQIITRLQPNPYNRILLVVS